MSCNKHAQLPLLVDQFTKRKLIPVLRTAFSIFQSKSLAKITLIGAQKIILYMLDNTDAIEVLLC